MRVGDTVRRPWRPWSRPVQALLEHVRSAGFLAVPAALGVGAEGREVLQWVEGNAGVEPVTPDIASDHALIEAARLIRRFHDVSAAFHWDAGGWNPLLANPSGSAEVICHNDLSTYNIVYRGAEPLALIDWEFACPGSRLWDLAYACVWLVPLHAPTYCEPAGWGHVEYARRLRLFCDSYGLGGTRHDLLDVIFERLARNHKQLRLWATQGIIDPAPDFQRLAADTAHIRRYRYELERALA
jgi:aminoglycoside phosphotransferase (APT) family kinase protein